MNIFIEKKGEKYNSLIGEYEKYLPDFFKKLEEAHLTYSYALDNEEYNSYVIYNKWPIRRLEYSFVIKEMEKYIEKGRKVLEAGCGVSPMPFLWSKIGADVTAVDLSEKTIRLMKQFSEDDYFKVGEKIDFAVCDIMKLPYEDNSFDIVETISVIEHLQFPNYLMAINELYRVLKPGGVLICTCDISSQKEMKLSSIGAFSAENIKGILRVFKNELLEESKDFENLSVEQKDIDEFWENHYYDGIGYEKSRGYGAVGFSLKKQGAKDKYDELLGYDAVLDGLMKLQKYCSKLEMALDEKEKVIVELAEESKKRLEIINRISKTV